MQAYVVLSGLTGFDKLQENEVKEIYEIMMPEYIKRLQNHKEASKDLILNFCNACVIFDNSKSAINFMIDIREFYKTFYDKINGINSNLSPYILGHYDDVKQYYISSMELKNFTLSKAKKAASYNVELPSSDPYVTYDFRFAIAMAKERTTGFKFVEIGFMDTGDYFGDLEVWKLMRDGEESQGYEKLKTYDFSYSLPENEGITLVEKAMIDRIKSTKDVKKLIEVLTIVDTNNKSCRFLLELSSIYISLSLYERAEEIINQCREKHFIFEGVKVYPFRYDLELLMKEAVCKIRLFKFEEAYNILYGQYKNHGADMSLIKTLAFYFKRKAMFDSEGRVLINMSVNRNLLYKSKDLYLEAFRKSKMQDFESALDAASLFKIIGKTEGEKAKRLSKYIIYRLNKNDDKSLYSKVIIAQCYMYIDDYLSSIEIFREILSSEGFTLYDKKDLYENLFLYEKLAGSNFNSLQKDGVSKILELFK